MTLDTNGEDVRQIAETPFEGADGNGIMRIDLGGEVANLIGAPRVDIENVDGGEGYGATAVAAWDPETRVLKGVHVTSHGWGYTQGKVKVTLSTGSTVLWSKILTGDAITVGANVAGGFTKRGAGTLTLNATNTWAQWTKVEGGTLKANADWAIPAGTDVTLSGGGILDFNGKTGEVASVTYGVDGGSIINAENVVLPQNPSFTLDVEDLLADRVIPVTGDFNFDGVEIRLTGDLTRLDPETCRRHTLISVSGGAASGMPSLAGSELPEEWVLVVEGDRVRLVRPHGFTFTVR
jgi:autotransporter-associated beta strand protein